jgi:hypothetical protein
MIRFSIGCLALLGAALAAQAADTTDTPVKKSTTHHGQTLGELVGQVVKSSANGPLVLKVAAPTLVPNRSRTGRGPHLPTVRAVAKEVTIELASATEVRRTDGAKTVTAATDDIRPGDTVRVRLVREKGGKAEADRVVILRHNK